MQYYVMRRMIDPGRFVESEATNGTSSKQLQQKTGAEAVEEWEDEGGALSHPGDRIVISDLSPIRGNKVKKGAKCT